MIWEMIDALLRCEVYGSLDQLLLTVNTPSWREATFLDVCKRAFNTDPPINALYLCIYYDKVPIVGLSSEYPELVFKTYIDVVRIPDRFLSWLYSIEFHVDPLAEIFNSAGQGKLQNNFALHSELSMPSLLGSRLGADLENITFYPNKDLGYGTNLQQLRRYLLQEYEEFITRFLGHGYNPTKFT